MKTILSSLLFLFSFTFLIEDSFAQDSAYYYESGMAKQEIKDYKGAIVDFNKAIKLETNEELLSYIYYARGTTKAFSGNMEGACEDFVTSSRLGYEYADEMYRTFCE
jgi:tetratricopeptide (TPR) repeat protein